MSNGCAILFVASKVAKHVHVLMILFRMGMKYEFFQAVKIICLIGHDIDSERKES